MYDTTTGVKITFQKWSNQCRTGLMIDLTCWSGNCPGVFVCIMVCSGPTWLVGLPATKNVCNFSHTNYTGGNHSVNLTFLAENVRSNKEMGSYLANVVSFQ